MGRIIRTVEGGGADSALTSTDVTELIQASNEWEYIETTEISSEIGSVTNTFDTSIYDGFKVVILGGQGTSNSYGSPYFRFTDTYGTEFSDNYYSYDGFKWYNPTSGYTANGQYTSIAFPSSSLFFGANKESYIEYEMNFLKSNKQMAHIKAHIGPAGTGGYWGSVTEGNYYQGTNVIGGVVFNLGGAGLNGAKVVTYGRRIR